MSLVCRYYVVFMSFLCRLKILQLPDIKPNTTLLCHMSLDFRIFGLYLLLCRLFVPMDGENGKRY